MPYKLVIFYPIKTVLKRISAVLCYRSGRKDKGLRRVKGRPGFCAIPGELPQGPGEQNWGEVALPIRTSTTRV